MFFYNFKKSIEFLTYSNSHTWTYPAPKNLNYFWTFGSLLGVCLALQIITGFFLSIFYKPSILEAFSSIENFVRDVDKGWLVRYFHSNGASFFFFFSYSHIAKGIYYQSFKKKKTLVFRINYFYFINGRSFYRLCSSMRSNVFLSSYCNY